VTRTLKTTAKRQAISFLIVGVIGFAVDAALFWVLVRVAEWQPVTARIAAFLPATVATWILNRWMTFFTAHLGVLSLVTEYCRYLGVQAIGIGINFAVFYFALWGTKESCLSALIPFALGSLAAMVFNFVGAKYFAFSQASNQKAK
jgi:putative flippase GtrA